VFVFEAAVVQAEGLGCRVGVEELRGGAAVWAEEGSGDFGGGCGGFGKNLGPLS
jgi:hypothetical protein